MNKTIELILDGMRRWADECIHNVGRDVLRRNAHKFCDLLEATAKRDAAIHAMTCEAHALTCEANELLREHLEIALENDKRISINEEQMRKALQKIVSLTNSLDENCAVDPVEIRDIAKNALSGSSVG